MILAHRIRLVPTLEQEIYFRRACGVARFAYNWALAEWKRQYDAGTKPSEVALRKALNAIKDDPKAARISRAAFPSPSGSTTRAATSARNQGSHTRPPYRGAKRT